MDFLIAASFLPIVDPSYPSPQMSIPVLALQLRMLSENQQRTLPFQASHKACRTQLRQYTVLQADTIRHDDPLLYFHFFVFVSVLMMSHQSARY